MGQPTCPPSTAMYESFFGLSRAPFSLASDSNCIHVTPALESVMRSLFDGVLQRRGCLALTAKPGLGKTTVLNALSDLLIDSYARTSMISVPTITADEFLELLMLNFGIQDVPVSKARRLKVLEGFLLRSDEEDRVSALIVDEAQRLSDEVLEEIRLLSNFEAGDQKLLQIVLAGQSELDDRLNQPDMWQFKQRIATRLTLYPLDLDDVADYVSFRWSEAGGGTVPFTPEALTSIAAWSAGVPRIVNVICHNTLIKAAAAKKQKLDVGLIRNVCTELDLPTPPVEHLLVAAPKSEAQPIEAPPPSPPQATEPQAAEPEAPRRRVPSGGIWKRLWPDASGEGKSIRPKSVLSLEDPPE